MNPEIEIYADPKGGIHIRGKITLPPGAYLVLQTVMDVPLHMNPDYKREGQRFGRVTKDYGYLGELRKQKKAPHVEVFYIWVKDPKQDKFILRSVPNCSNDQLTEAIKQAGELIDKHKVPREDGEFVLDILYRDLSRRIYWQEKQRNARSQ